jgi:hypothetical protein
MPTVGTACVIAFATPHTIVHRALSVKPVVGIGLISYSAYLWHLPLFVFARYHVGRSLTAGESLGLAGLTVVLAYASWRFVETPFRSRDFLPRRMVFGLAGAVAVVLTGAGFYMHVSDGGINRYAPEDREIAGFDFTDAGRYTGSRFATHMLAEFDGSARKKVVLIGDSYAQNLMNALYESGLVARMQLSTYLIRARCGNLFLDKDFSRQLREVHRLKCRQDGWYDNAQLQKLMREADTIWLASSWEYWQVDLLAESVQNLRRQFKGKVVVFGRKNFGSIEMPLLLRVPSDQRKEVTNHMAEESIRVNERMKAVLPAEVFLDVADRLCGAEYRCPLFTEEGRLISYDGAHLTKAGAAYYGRKLSGHPFMREFLPEQ